MRAGFAHLNPGTGSGTSFAHVPPAPLAGVGVDISKETLLFFSVAKDITPQLEIELAAGLPPTHDIAVRVAPSAPGVLGQFDGRVLAQVRQVAPNLYLNYKFGDAQSSWRPFVGLGLNYTHLSARSVSAIGSNVGGLVDLHIGSSWGLAAQAGLLFRINEQFDIAADVRWIDIDAKVKVDGGEVGKVTVDPLVYGLALNYRF